MSLNTHLCKIRLGHGNTMVGLGGILKPIQSQAVLSAGTSLMDQAARGSTQPGPEHLQWGTLSSQGLTALTVTSPLSPYSFSSNPFPLSLSLQGCPAQRTEFGLHLNSERMLLLLPRALHCSEPLSSRRAASTKQHGIRSLSH